MSKDLFDFNNDGKIDVLEQQIQHKVYMDSAYGRNNCSFGTEKSNQVTSKYMKKENDSLAKSNWAPRKYITKDGKETMGWPLSTGIPILIGILTAIMIMVTFAPGLLFIAGIVILTLIARQL